MHPTKSLDAGVGRVSLPLLIGIVIMLLLGGVALHSRSLAAEQAVQRAEIAKLRQADAGVMGKLESIDKKLNVLLDFADQQADRAADGKTN